MAANAPGWPMRLNNDLRYGMLDATGRRQRRRPLLRLSPGTGNRQTRADGHAVGRAAVMSFTKLNKDNTAWASRGPNRGWAAGRWAIGLAACRRAQRLIGVQAAHGVEAQCRRSRRASTDDRTADRQAAAADRGQERRPLGANRVAELSAAPAYRSRGAGDVGRRSCRLERPQWLIARAVAERLKQRSQRRVGRAGPAGARYQITPPDATYAMRSGTCSRRASSGSRAFSRSGPRTFVSRAAPTCRAPGRSRAARLAIVVAVVDTGMTLTIPNCRGLAARLRLGVVERAAGPFNAPITSRRTTAMDATRMRPTPAIGSRYRTRPIIPDGATRMDRDKPRLEQPGMARMTGTIVGQWRNGVGRPRRGHRPPASRQCIVVPVRGLGKCGGRPSDIADAIGWAAGGRSGAGNANNANPARVINLSLGSTSGACSYLPQRGDRAASSGQAL